MSVLSAVPPNGASAIAVVGESATPCFACLRRTWLLGALVGRIEHTRRSGAARIPLLLALGDRELVDATRAGAEVTSGYRAFDRDAALARLQEAELTAICRHDSRYPAVLAQLPDAPAVLHVAGDVERFTSLTAPDQPAVAVVGARRASAYGVEVARGLGRGLAVADVTVVSGMALGIDAAAHIGALDAGGPTVAVLAAGAERPYPPSKHRVYRQIRRSGSVVSELPPGTDVHRWCFPARNRLIAGLARMTVVVEAMERSGSLITAEFARDMGRDVGAVPGHVTSPLASGPNALLADGAHVIRRAEDALDVACGVGAWRRRAPVGAGVPEHLADLYAAVAQGLGTADDLVERGFPIGVALAGLAELELLGHARRLVGGRYVATLQEGT